MQAPIGRRALGAARAPDRLRLPAVPPQRRRERAGQRRRRAALHGRAAPVAQSRARARRWSASGSASAPRTRRTSSRAASASASPSPARSSAHRHCCWRTSRPATSTRRSGASIVDLLHELNHAGTTVVVITHDRELAGRLPRQVAIRDGRRRLRRATDMTTVRGPPATRRRRAPRHRGPARATDPRGPLGPGHRDRHRRDDRGRQHLGVEPGAAERAARRARDQPADGDARGSRSPGSRYRSRPAPPAASNASQACGQPRRRPSSATGTCIATRRSTPA